MKKFLLVAAALVMGMAANAQTVTLSAESIDNAKAGGKADLVVAMETKVDVAGLSFRLYCPEGITIAKKKDIAFSEEVDPDENFILNFMNTTDGAYQISYVSPTSKADKDARVKPGKNDLVTVSLTIAADVAEGVYDLKIARISVSDPEAVSISKQEDFIVQIGVGCETAIDGISADAKSGAIYNLAGQRVNKAQKGIYIQDGKKVLK